MGESLPKVSGTLPNLFEDQLYMSKALLNRVRTLPDVDIYHLKPVLTCWGQKREIQVLSPKSQVVFVILIESAKGGEEKNLIPHREILLPIYRDQDDKWVGSEW